MTDLFDSWIYETNVDNSARFVIGEKGDNPLVCIGVNPSTATPDKLDPTLRRVKAFAKKLGYDGWIMLNLYPQRATKPNNLHKQTYGEDELKKSNAFWWDNIFRQYYWVTVWAAWGVSIKKRKYLKEWLENYLDAALETGDGPLSLKWITIGERSQDGHPHHPLYLPNDAAVREFNVIKYLKDLEAEK